jgi:hypothetical protein
MKITNFWDKTLGSLVGNCQHFGGNYCIHFCPEAGSSRLHQNGKFLPDYGAATQNKLIKHQLFS